jgi:hypothetical protein
MASTINASTSGAGGVITTADNSGILQLQSGGTTIATISSTGVQTNVGAPAFAAYASTNQSVAAATVTKVLFDTELFDTNNNFASSRFTPTIAGYYQFNTNLYFSGTGSNQNINFYKNGALYIQPVYFVNGFIMASASALIYLNGSTDYVEVYFGNSNAGNLGGGSGSPFVNFSGFLARSA